MSGTFPHVASARQPGAYHSNRTDLGASSPQNSPSSSLSKTILQRSTQFPCNNPTTKRIDKKRITCKSNNYKEVQHALEKEPPDNILAEKANAMQDMQKFDAAVSSFLKSGFKSAKTHSKSQASPEVAPPQPSPQQKNQIIEAIASIFNCDCRYVERCNLPLEVFLETSTVVNPQGLESMLHISCKAMETCILPFIAKFGEDRPIQIDFAFCTVEDNALVPLLNRVCLSPDTPNIRLGRQLTPLEQKEMRKRIHVMMKSIPLKSTASIKKYPDKNKKYYHYDLKFSSKACFEPVYYVNQPQNRSDNKPLELEETYHRLKIEHMEHEGNSYKMIKRSDASAFFSSDGSGISGFIVGKNKLWRENYSRHSIENHPSLKQHSAGKDQINQPQMSPAPNTTPGGPVPSMATGIFKKPLPPAPKAKISLTAEVEHCSKEGDSHLIKKEIDKAIEAYTKGLELAEKLNDPLIISDCLMNLGKAFLEKSSREAKEWTMPANLFNSALALCLNDENRRNALLKQMAEVERRYLKEVCHVSDHVINAHLDYTQYLKRRQHLRDIRRFVTLEGGTIVASTQATIKQYSKDIRAFDVQLFSDMYPLLGQPPCAYTNMALGSFGREEMCFFSDKEFAVLVAREDPDVLDWFRKAIQLNEIRVIHLGETEFKILNRGTKSVTESGYGYDPGGNTPCKKKGNEELIKTPEALANFQSPTNFNRELILSNALRSTSFLMGNKELYQRYLNSMQAILNGMIPGDPLTIRKRKALDLMEGHLKEFKPDINAIIQNEPFDAKKHFCRLIIFLVQGLSEYLGINATNTWDKLQELKRRGFLDGAAVNNLSMALGYGMNLRLKSHEHNGCECDKVFHPATPHTDVNNPYILSKPEIKQVIEIFRVLFPLHRAFQSFCENQELEKLKNQIFYDESLFKEWEMMEAAPSATPSHQPVPTARPTTFSPQTITSAKPTTTHDEILEGR